MTRQRTNRKGKQLAVEIRYLLTPESGQRLSRAFDFLLSEVVRHANPSADGESPEIEKPPCQGRTQDN